MPNPITAEVLENARNAVRAPVPMAKPCNIRTREHWRDAQEPDPMTGKKLLPSQRMMQTEAYKWAGFNPLDENGMPKPDEELRKIADKLSIYPSHAWIVYGQESTEKKPLILGVVLDDVQYSYAKCLYASTDRPGQRLELNAKERSITFYGAKYFRNLNGHVEKGCTLSVKEIPAAKIHAHSMGAECQVVTCKKDELSLHAYGKCKLTTDENKPNVSAFINDVKTKVKTSEASNATLPVLPLDIKRACIR